MRPFVIRIAFAFGAIALMPALALGQWQTHAVGTDADLRGLSVGGEKVIWASGTKGTVIRTADSGKTWAVLTVPGAEKLDFRDIETFGDSTAYVLSIGPGPDSRIYKTTDAGKTWAEHFRNSDKNAFYDAIAFWDESHGLALSDPVNGHYRILTTDDGGKTWTVKPTTGMPPANPNEGAFAASGTCLVTQGESNAWFVTGGGGVGRVFRTTDRGKTWAVTDTPIKADVASAGIFSIAMRDAKNGMIVGGDYKLPNGKGPNAAITTDGGETWTAVKTPRPFRSAVAVHENMWFAVGTSGAESSRDNGLTWKAYEAVNANAVRFGPSRIAWVVGPKGYVASLKD
jgi:photosystem II stability/assembly factor-like uncharacterized protein